MSSPLDGRIRAIAREEATALLGFPGGAQAVTPTPDQMQQQITDLHEHLHLAATNITRLEERVAELEKAGKQTDQAARRTPRKASGAAATPE